MGTDRRRISRHTHRLLRRYTSKRMGKLTNKAITLAEQYNPAGDPVQNLKILARVAKDIDTYLTIKNHTKLASFQAYLQTVVSRVHAEIKHALDEIKLAKQVAHGVEAANANDELSRMLRALVI